MVVDDGERVHGLLIDFDHAIKTDKSRMALAEHAGTLPFMSICNLQNSEIQRSELDDWESLLYVVCWLGVYGVSQDEQVAYRKAIGAARKVGEYYRHPLAKWNAGSCEDVADTKLVNLISDSSFNRSVLCYFQKGTAYDKLKYLARGLRFELFANSELGRPYQGLFDIDDMPDAKSFGKRVKSLGIRIKSLGRHTEVPEVDVNDSEEDEKYYSIKYVNPFEKRLEPKARKHINGDLLALMSECKEAAIAALYEKSKGDF
ncbi:hypothetical protein IWW56_005998 [Coemansia sp. RSA 2131]|nr:hypothetical protein IWW56_005998 [Coemansia sp. RSA 2131]